MSEFALRDENGNIHPTQVAYFDGYGVADRLLEGVLFRVAKEGDTLVCTGVQPDDEDYMKTMSPKAIAEWKKEIVDMMINHDAVAYAEDGTNLRWRDA